MTRSLREQLAEYGVPSELCSQAAWRAGSGIEEPAEETPAATGGRPTGDIDQGGDGRGNPLDVGGEFRSADAATVAAELRKLGVR